jgi:hypothetical protein
MPEDDHVEELEKLVEENRKAFERAKRLLDQAKRKARQKPSNAAPSAPADIGGRPKHES